MVVPSSEPGLLAAPERELAALNAAPDVAANLAPRPATLAEIRDPFLAPSNAPPERAQPSVPVSRPVVVAIPTAPPAPKSGGSSSGSGSGSGTTNSISGAASWYCEAGRSPCTVGYPDDGGMDAYAAAGPKLRAALGSNWRGRIIYVDGIRVKVIDWCQCYKGEAHEKILDLYYDVFARTGSRVTIRW